MIEVDGVDGSRRKNTVQSQIVGENEHALPCGETDGGIGQPKAVENRVGEKAPAFVVEFLRGFDLLPVQVLKLDSLLSVQRI